MESNLIPDYDWMTDVGGVDGEFQWALDSLNYLPIANANANAGAGAGAGAGDANANARNCNTVEIDAAGRHVCGIEQASSRKRARDECSGLMSKASREKIRRERLNDRFLELGTILDPERPPRSDKATMLSDAVRLLGKLRTEAQQLKEENEKLQETINDLKVEKNDLRDEKIKLKGDKERLEEQVKSMNVGPIGFMPHPAALHAAAFAAQGQAAANKTAAPFPAFPGVAMWQWMPPAVMDTSQDHTLRPPVA